MTSPSRTHVWGLALLLASASWLSAGDCAGHAQLRLVPRPGTYPCVVPVGVLGRLAAGERLVYTVDGSDPSAAAWPVRHPILLTDPTTVRVGVIDAHGAVARQVAGTYVVHGILATARPFAAPAPGTYAGPVAVTLRCPTPGATIRYTVDGSEPTERSPRYSAPLQLNVSTTVHARAWGGRISVRIGRWTVQVPAVFPSGVLTARYVLGAQMQQVATPTIAPAGGIYGTVLSATATTATVDADLRYRLDGADPQASDPLLPAAGLAIDRSLTLTVRGFRTGWTPSVVAHADYTLHVPDPSITPPSGVAHAPLLATVAVPADAVATYTLDGSDPTTTSPQITGPVTIDRTTTLRVQARRDGWEPSAIVVAAWTLQPLTPTVSLPTGTYTGEQAISLSVATAGAQVRYTLDGSTPTAASPLADGPILLPGTCTLQAIAVRDGWTPSPILTAAYELVVQTPTASLAAGTFADIQSVTLSSATTGATIHFTRDSSDPVASSEAATGPILIDRSATLIARAFRAGWTTSPAWSATYTLQVQPVTADLPAGSYVGERSVTLATSTAEAAIRYTLDGSDPAASTTAQTATAPIVLPGSCVMRAVSTRAGWQNGAPFQAAYDLQVPAPVISPASGAATAAIPVAVTGVGSLHYTLDGNLPVLTSPVVPADLVIDRSGTLTVIAFRDGWTPSAPVSATYALQVLAPTVLVSGGTYTTEQSVVVASATPGSSIRATLDGSDPLSSATAQIVSAPLMIDHGLTLRAIAVRDGWTASTELTQTYVFQLPTPVLSPAAGTLSTPTLVQATASAGTVHVTTDGSDPTAASPVLSPEGLTLDAPASVAVIAVRDGWLSSPIVRADYAFQVATPTWDSPPAPATGSVTIAAHSTSPDVTLRYTLDGSDPDATSPMLPVTLTRTRTVTVRGFRSGWTPSAALVATWIVTPTIACAQPTLTLPVDAGSTPVALHLSDVTDHDVTVTLQGIDGTAVFGTDLTLSATTLTIPAGQAEGSVTVQALAGAADRVTVRASLLLADATGAVVDATASTVVITIPGVSGPPPTFTERRSPLWRLPAEPFDAQRWADDVAYRTAYLAAEVPERVWETARAVQTATLKVVGSAYGRGPVGSRLSFTLSGTSAAPVNWLIYQPGIAACGGESVGSYQMSPAGSLVLEVTILGQGVTTIVCASPLSKGRIAMTIEGVVP